MRAFRIYDGPTEVHKVTVARQHIREYRNLSDSIFPEYATPQLKEAALEQYGDLADTVRDIAEAAGAD